MERLEDRLVPSAVRSLPGFAASAIARGDDNPSGLITLPFSVNFFGQVYSHLYISNNGHVSFQPPSGLFVARSLVELNKPIIAPFHADVDTRPSNGGRVSFGFDTVAGHEAFAVTWNGVGYFNQQTDRTNLFQVVLIEREDIGPGAFDVELNYDRIEWETVGTYSAHVGFSSGTGDPDDTFQLAGSGVNGAFLDSNPTTGLIHQSVNTDLPGRYIFFARDGDLSSNQAPQLSPIADQVIHEGQSLFLSATAIDLDGQPLAYMIVSGPDGATIDANGVIRWTPSATQPPGTYTFRVGVSDNGQPVLRDEEQFSVILAPLPRVELDGATLRIAAADTPVPITGKVLTTFGPGWSAKIDFGDGSASVPLTIAADGSFSLEHSFSDQGNFTVQVTVTDAYGVVGTDRFEVVVLPANSTGKIEEFEVITVRAGEQGSASVDSPARNTQVDVELVRASDAQEPATLFVAMYTSPPVNTNRRGVFFDIQLDNASEGDQISLTFSSKLIGQRFEFGFFKPGTNEWVSLLNAPQFADVTIDAATGTMTVRFKVTNIFSGTVFTVSLPSGSASTTTGTIRPPTAQGPGPTGAGSDGSPGLTRSASFTSNTQLSLALTASRDSQLAVRGTAQGSQGGTGSTGGTSAGVTGALSTTLLSATANTGGGPEGEGEKANSGGFGKGKGDDGSFWRWLQSDEGLLELMLYGIDPASILFPIKADNLPSDEEGDQAEFEKASLDTEIDDLVESAVIEPTTIPGDDAQADGALMTMALLPGILAGVRSRRSRRTLEAV
jgi:hypothetical protein